MEALLRDIKYGVRLLLQNPGVTIIAVLSLALGIGANTAMFSWANALILTPIRVADADSLVRVYTTHPGGFDEGSLSWPDFEDLRRDNDVFADMAAFAPGFVSFTEGEGTERIGASLVSGNYFEFLHVEPGSGRWFRADEDEVPGRDAVVVISNGFWKRRYASDPGVVGRTITLNGQPFTVVGVAAEGFRLAAEANLANQQIQLSRLVLEKPREQGESGHLRATGTVDLKTRQYSVSATSEDLSLENLTLPGNILLKSSLDFAAQGTGTIGNPSLALSVQARDLMLDNRPFGEHLGLQTLGHHDAHGLFLLVHEHDRANLRTHKAQGMVCDALQYLSQVQ